MFETRRRRHPVQTAFGMAELIFNWAVRNLSIADRNPAISVIKGVLQSLVMIAVFYAMFNILGMRGTAVRGDFMMYLLSGIVCFLTHNATMSAVAGSPGPEDPMMKHAPMNPTIAICSAALGALYKQVLSIGLLLFVYHAVTGNVAIHNFMGTLGMFMLSWFSGLCVGTAFLGLRQHAPAFVQIAQLIYRRANMIFSGKMFLANSLPGTMLAMFDWNPLFHIIDQTRGFIFVNYNPHFSNVGYPLKVSIAVLVLGMIFEFGKRGTGAVTRAAGH